jgi:hypothetical protein
MISSYKFTRQQCPKKQNKQEASQSYILLKHVKIKN